MCTKVVVHMYPWPHSHEVLSPSPSTAKKRERWSQCVTGQQASKVLPEQDAQVFGCWVCGEALGR